VGYNFFIMLKPLKQKVRWVAVGLVIFGAIVFVAYKEHAASQEYEREREGRCESVFALYPEKQDACKHERDSPSDHLPWWYVLVAWPEGITTWAIILTFVVIGWQSRETRKAAEAAKVSAEAATLNATTLVSAERAWVQVEMAKEIEWVKAQGGEVSILIWPVIKNYGRTPAQVDLIVIRPHQVNKDKNFPNPPELPAKPEYVSPETVYTDKQGFLPQTMGISPVCISISKKEFDIIRSGEVFFYIYGEILYGDITGQGRTSRFCYLYWVPPSGATASHPEGFLNAGNTPAAYTECT
jgi:hypothetical protein